MRPQTKIATCCYCGTRAALVLGKDRHELSCAGCGAPLHEMKMLREAPETPARKPAKVKRGGYDLPLATKPRKKKKRRKSLFSKMLEEAWDVVEDIID